MQANEEDINTNLLLQLFRELLRVRSDLSVIIMTSSNNTADMTDYFIAAGITVGQAHAPLTKTHTVSKYFLEDMMENDMILKRGDEYSERYIKAELASSMDGDGHSSLSHDSQIEDSAARDIPFNLITTIISHICFSSDIGTVLVVLPGWDEISRIHGQLLKLSLRDTAIVPLHIFAGPSTVDDIFISSQGGFRKVILTTSAVESCLSIPGVVHVVDSGREKVPYFDRDHCVNRLEMCWISGQSRNRRISCAATAQHGFYYGLYSKNRMQAPPVPLNHELLRADLDQVIH